MLHHVTSFNGYDRAAAARAIGVQAKLLAPGGVLVVRDFLDPGPGSVLLDVPDDDAPENPVGAGGSTAALLVRFSREFKMLNPPDQRGFPLEAQAVGAEGPPLAPGWRRFLLDRRHAVEFILRKDYRRDWDLEVQEEYTYLTQAGFERACAARGLRLLASTPIRNPWIVQHRFEGRLRWWSLEGEELDWPATNYVVAAERVGEGEGVGFSAEPVAPRGYLRLTHWRRAADGAIQDLVSRPGTTVDILPWFREGEALHVLARRSYPRPLLHRLNAAGPALDGTRAPLYVTEPLNGALGDGALGEVIERVLAAADVPPDDIRRVDATPPWYPSAGGLQEQITTVRVQIAPTRVALALPAASGFGTSGVVRAMEACQVLRAAQVGGLPDARLEVATYGLLQAHGLDVGPWIGAEIEVPAGPDVEATPVAAAVGPAGRRRFTRTQAGAGFLALEAARFTELDALHAAGAAQVLEWVEPVALSLQTIAIALLCRVGDAVLVGVQDDDRPTAQAFTGHSDLPVAPAWRLPRDVVGQRAAERWVRRRLMAELGVDVGPLRPLGGRYHPSPGATPEVVYPCAAAVRTTGTALRWVPLADLARAQESLRDGHLRIVVLRAAHALGLL
ncbi:MAG: SAM-dependent methyltransferase [bacterium]